MKARLFSQTSFLLAGLAFLTMSASAANAASVTWRFLGNEYTGTGDHLAGEITVTLDDEGTPGSVKVVVDATALPATATDSITVIYFNTTFDSDSQFITTTVQNDAGGSFKAGASNEDGISAGNTAPNFDNGPLFDFRLTFNTPGDGAPFFDQSNDLFEATFESAGLTVDDFLTPSAANPNGQPGDPGPFEVALRAVQLDPGQGGGFFFGTDQDASPAGGVHVFVTSQTFTGALGGIDGANDLCGQAAIDAGIGNSLGDWQAWVSINGNDARDRIVDSRYRLLDGTAIADSLADLTDGSLDAPINLDENLATVNPNPDVWTGTAADGTWSTAASGTCDLWTSEDGARSGLRGQATQTDDGWTRVGGNSCDLDNRLYCFSTQVITEVTLDPSIASEIPGLGISPGGSYRAPGNSPGTLFLPQTDLTDDLLSHDGGSFRLTSSGTSNFYTYGDWVLPLLDTCVEDGDACEVNTSGGNGAPWAVRRYEARNGTAELVFTQAGAQQFNDLAGVGDPVIQVFVTNAPGNGDLGGLSGADTICTNAAASGGLSGEWTAWLSDSTTDARDRIGDGEYRLPDGVTPEAGTLVASSLADLTDGTLASPIDKTAAGGQLGPLNVWTGTKPDGTLADGTANEVTCDDWTNGTSGPEFGATGVVGDLTATNGDWTEISESVSDCGAGRQLYCFSRRPFRAERRFATVGVQPVPPACQIGKYTGDSLVLLDANENAAWDGPGVDILHGLAQVFPRGIAISGDWNGDGEDDMGKFDPSNNAVYLDLNGNKVWDQPAGGDLQSTFAAFAGSGIPIAGDWDDDGADEIGLYVPGEDQFYLDLDGDGTFIGTNDQVAVVGPDRTAGEPIVGDWNGDGRSSVGKVIAESSTYYLDSDGDFAWNAATDRASVFANFATPYTPVAGNFSSESAGDEIGKYVPGSGTDDLFLLDTNDDGIYTNGVDALSAVAQVFGAGTPIICDFNADGIDDIGKAVSSNDSASCGGGQCYFLDANGNGVWDGFGVDVGSTFGAFTDPADTMSEPISGVWVGGAGGGD